MKPIIRPFAEADRASAIALFLQLNRHEFAISGDRRIDRGGAEFCVEDMMLAVEQGAVALVAETGGSIVGLLVWAAHTDEAYMADAARRHGSVQDIVIAETHRGKGLGRLLLDEAERLTKEAGMTRLKLTVLAGNEGAEAAYRRFGFRHYATTMIKDLD